MMVAAPSAIPQGVPDIMWMIATIVFVGLAAGWAANLLVRGEKHPSDWALLLVVGVVGSLLGGIVVNLIAGNGFELAFSGIIASIVMACVLLWIVGMVRGRGRRTAPAKGAGPKHEPRGGRKKH
jgi:uncharacterized membrane protein YeaQ/YmgE (transglycosylase-associated protein family)